MRESEAKASRPIKFRAWHKDTKNMVDWDYIHKNDYFSVFLDGTVWELMQFTGLKDKNGVEIYEGDIVRYQDFNTSDRIWKTADVQWMCWADWSNVPFLHPFGSPVSGQNREQGRSVETCFITPPTECEVIGNIYENPELIK